MTLWTPPRPGGPFGLGGDGTDALFGSDRDDPLFGRSQAARDDAAAAKAANPYYPTEPTAVESQSFDSSLPISFTVLCGLRGRGKSTYAVFLIWLIWTLTHMRGGHRPVYSNIRVDFAEEYDPRIYQKVQANLEKYAHCFLLLDEISELFSSKRALSETVVAFENLVTMLRKLDCEMLGTCQFPRKLPSAVQEQIDFLIQPEMFRRRVTAPDGSRQEIVAIKSEWYNWNGSLTGDPRYGERWPPEPDTADQVRWDYGVQKVFPLFDTGELVDSPHTDAGRARLAAQQAQRSQLDLIKLGREELAKALGRPGATWPIKQFHEWAEEWFGQHVTPDALEYLLHAFGLTVQPTDDGISVTLNGKRGENG